MQDSHDSTLLPKRELQQIETLSRPDRNIPRIFAWYFAAFITAAFLWHLSATVRSVDALELPMAAFYFPLAGFIDPHDGMVNDRTSFFGGVAFWGAAIALSLQVTPKRLNPLVVALTIVGVCSASSVIYVIVRAMFAQPMVCIG